MPLKLSYHESNHVPHPLEGLPPMIAKGLYRYLETLTGFVECQARVAQTNGQGRSSSSRDN